MGFFTRKRPEPERTEADDIRELRAAYADITAPSKDAWAWFPTVFQACFGLLSFLGTYIGLRDIISAGDLQAGPVGDAMVFGLVALATGAMIYFLRRAVSDPWSLVGAGSILAYLILLFFSVTFGFAFYWGRLEARQQAVSGASARLEQLSDEINITAVGLSRTVDELTVLETEFRRLAEVEESVGGTCGDGSGGGYGPRTRHRHRRAEEIRSRVSQLQPRFQSVAPAVTALEGKMAEITAMAKLPADETSDLRRRELFREARATARTAATEINALTQDPLIADVSRVFSRWGQEYSTANLTRGDDPEGVPYVCYSVAAGDALSSAGERLASLPDVDVPDLPDYVGPAATREAVFRMVRSAGEVFSGAWAAIPLIGGGSQYQDPDADTAFRAGVKAALGGRAGDAESISASAETGLVEADRFPLLIAVIVDALLFVFVLIDRPSSQYFGRFQRKIRNAIEEKLDPLEMVALRRALNDDPNWALLRKYRFTVNDRVLLAQPLDIKQCGDPLIEAEAEAVQDLLQLWRRNGLVRRQDLTSDEIREELIRAGSTDLANRFQEFRAFRFTDRAFEVILMRGLFVGASRPAESLRAREIARLQVAQQAEQAALVDQTTPSDRAPAPLELSKAPQRRAELDRAGQQALALSADAEDRPEAGRRAPRLPRFLRSALRAEDGDG